MILRPLPHGRPRRRATASSTSPPTSPPGPSSGDHPAANNPSGLDKTLSPKQPRPATSSLPPNTTGPPLSPMDGRFCAKQGEGGTLYSATLKSKIATVVPAIGLPLSSRGLYRHRCTASVAASRSSGGPLTARAETTLPAGSTTACTVTWPSTRAADAAGGYAGAGLKITFAAVIPAEPRCTMDRVFADDGAPLLGSPESSGSLGHAVTSCFTTVTGTPEFAPAVAGPGAEPGATGFCELATFDVSAAPPCGATAGATEPTIFGLLEKVSTARFTM